MDDFNPYTAPEAGVSGASLAADADEGRGVWRDGDTLVMAKLARLPSRCVACNAPSTYRLKRSYSWHSPWLFLAVVSPLIYLILALILRKTARIQVPLCDEHRARRSSGIAIAWVIALAGIGILCSTALVHDQEVGVPVFLGVVTLIVGMVFGSLRSQVVVPRKIDKTHAWLKKVGAAYLAELPPLPHAGEPGRAAKPKLSLDEL